jgi:FkbM family methyltransferase
VPHQAGNKSTNTISDPGTSRQVLVPSLSIDSYCHQHGIRPDVAKIDVEGTAGKVLQGMKETLHAVETLFLEVLPSLLPSFGDSMEDMGEVLDSCEFLMA